MTGPICASTDTGAILLYIAMSMTGGSGSISNSMIEVKGGAGTVLIRILSAVNTGVIMSGVDSAMKGKSGVSGANVASN